MEEAGNRLGRVGIFGGTFDPIHVGHLQIAEAAREQHRLDRVVFVPARRQPMKASAPIASGEQRVAMVELAIEDRPAFAVSGCELARAGKSYTIDTIRDFGKTLGAAVELFFILGSDSVRDLPNWLDLPGLVERCTLVVAARPGWPLDALDALEGQVPADQLAVMKAAVIHSTASAVSSSDIREQIAAGEPVDGLVPPAVSAYAAQNKLYSPA